MATEVESDGSEQTTLEQLNQEYVAAFMNADVEWYREHLADDFVCIESDGSVLNKNQFLLNTAKGPDVDDYMLHEVDVRIYGKVALVQATGSWTGKDKLKGISRYTDVYVKSDNVWKAISAQITRASKIDLADEASHSK
jgi:ketosteroid isomerase-like protein